MQLHDTVSSSNERLEVRRLVVDDYDPLIRVLDDWWGGRRMVEMLPRLFFIHFNKTSFVAEVDTFRVGFLIGFVSPSHPQSAYIHFAGIHPTYRRQGVGKALYSAFFECVRTQGCTRVGCVTSPRNKMSVQFHIKMGFVPDESEKQLDGVPYHEDYDGVGEHRVKFTKSL